MISVNITANGRDQVVSHYLFPDGSSLDVDPMAFPSNPVDELEPGTEHLMRDQYQRTQANKRQYWTIRVAHCAEAFHQRKEIIYSYPTEAGVTELQALLADWQFAINRLKELEEKAPVIVHNQRTDEELLRDSLIYKKQRQLQAQIMAMALGKRVDPTRVSLIG